jgi:hypothetical protein
LDIPSGVAVDAFGNLYIVDQDNNRIRKVAPNGIITTVAGKSGESGYSGDGGAATNASLFWPAGVGLDAAGNLYVADTQNQRIREVHSTANPVFTLTPVNALNAGNYTVVITSPYGSVTSVAATLTVATPAAITLQPANQFAVSGGNATFSVAVAGSGPFGYAWYFDSTNLVQSGTT